MTEREWLDALTPMGVAGISVLGVWLTTAATRAAQRHSRLVHAEERLSWQGGVILKLVNYAQRLRDAIYRRQEPPPEEWPEGVFDNGQSKK